MNTLKSRKPEQQSKCECEIETKADFSAIRYSQTWEDADILVQALNVQPHHHILSIGAAGDNTFSILAENPRRVTAIDLSFAQLALLELKVRAFEKLAYEDILILIGASREMRAHHRSKIYESLLSDLTAPVREYWDARPQLVASGLGNIGKFERYFAIFRKLALPLVHSQHNVRSLLSAKSIAERHSFYVEKWNSPLWRAMFRIFFSQEVMGMLGRDPAFFRYVDCNVAESLMSRVKHALTVLDPHANPYLQWILTGTYKTALPHYLRPENFERIRRNLNKLEWKQISLESYLAQAAPHSIDGFNLSDVFEYTSHEKYVEMLKSLVRAGSREARLVYWNMLAPRSRPAHLSNCLVPLTELEDKLYAQDKAFFYSKLVIEEVRK